RRKLFKHKRVIQHFPALPYTSIAAFMLELAQRPEIAARALEFLILTAARPNEALAARWSEIDLAEATWTLPAERMKSGRQHRVPLSGRPAGGTRMSKSEKYRRLREKAEWLAQLRREVDAESWWEVERQHLLSLRLRSRFRGQCYRQPPEQLAEQGARLLCGIAAIPAQHADMFAYRAAQILSRAGHWARFMDEIKAVTKLPLKEEKPLAEIEKALHRAYDISRIL